MAAETDRVHIIEYREDGLLVAQYGEGRRPPHTCCPYCTTEEQIIPMLLFEGALVCSQCGHTVREKVEAPILLLLGERWKATHHPRREEPARRYHGARV